MYCPFCGFNNPENNSNFCSQCGKAIPADEQKTVFVPNNTVRQQASSEQQTPPMQQRPPVQQVPPMQQRPPVQQTPPYQQGYPAAAYGQGAPGKKNSSKTVPIAIVTAVIAILITVVILFATGIINPDNKDGKETTQAAATEETTTEETTAEETTTEEITTEPEKQPLGSVEMAQFLMDRTVTVHTDVGTGTGFYIDSNGTLVTCYHVIEDASVIMVESSDGGYFEVEKILGFDWNQDIAVLKINIKNSLYLEFPEEPVLTGAKVYALGSSLGEYQSSFSDGVVASNSRIFSGVDCIQFTAAISPGNSGGPLVNEYGEIIGINAFKRPDGENINFAVKIDYINTLDKTRNLTVSDFVKWTKEENNKSYYFYNYSDGYFYSSVINTYQQITGDECAYSFYEWTSDEYYDGYDPEMGIFAYESDKAAFDAYIRYLAQLGFSCTSEDKDTKYISLTYTNERFGLYFDIVTDLTYNYIIIEPYTA